MKPTEAAIGRAAFLESNLPESPEDSFGLTYYLLWFYLGSICLNASVTSSPTFSFTRTHPKASRVSSCHDATSQKIFSMGCWFSSPHQARLYEAVDAGERAERTFGCYRAGSIAGGVIPPDNIDGLPSCQILDNFANKEPVSSSRTLCAAFKT